MLYSCALMGVAYVAIAAGVLWIWANDPIDSVTRLYQLLLAASAGGSLFAIIITLVGESQSRALVARPLVKLFGWWQHGGRMQS